MPPASTRRTGASMLSPQNPWPLAMRTSLDMGTPVAEVPQSNAMKQPRMKNQIPGLGLPKPKGTTPDDLHRSAGALLFIGAPVVNSPRSPRLRVKKQEGKLTRRRGGRGD